MSNSANVITCRLLDRLRQHASETPTKIAYHDIAADEKLTYRELHARALFLAEQLRSKYPAGSRILIHIPNTIEFPIAFFGLIAAGMAAFPISMESPEFEVNQWAKSSLSRVILSAAGRPAQSKDLASRSAGPSLNLESINIQARSFDSGEYAFAQNDISLMLLSSGSTGTPKIVCRSKTSLDAVSDQMCKAIGMQNTDRILATVPLCHSYGIEHGLLAPMWAGATVHLCRGLDLAVVSKQLSDAGITILPGVPSMFEMLDQLGADRITLPSMRAAYSAGGPLPASVAEAFTAKYGIQIGQIYGATEIGSITYSDPNSPTFNSRSVGQAMENVELQFGEGGQLSVRAASMFSGYLTGETPITDGFYPTGDLAEKDAHGNLIIAGRIKMLIDVGGLKVNPFEVEDVLMQHPDVGDCVVVPMRQTETVLRLKAIVTPRNAGRSPSIESLRQFARERLTSYKVPRLFEIRESLPRTQTGKLLRHLVEA